MPWVSNVPAPHSLPPRCVYGLGAHEHFLTRQGASLGAKIRAYTCRGSFLTHFPGFAGPRRSDPSPLLMATLVYSLEPSRRARRTTPLVNRHAVTVRVGPHAPPGYMRCAVRRGMRSSITCETRIEYLAKPSIKDTHGCTRRAPKARGQRSTGGGLYSESGAGPRIGADTSVTRVEV